MLIQAPEHPKRYSVAVTDFDVVNSKITVRQVCDLIERLAAAAYLEQILAVGKEGRASEITSADFIARHGLYSASSVQSAARQLLDKELLTKDGNVYRVYDRFFGLWIAQTYGTGYSL